MEPTTRRRLLIHCNAGGPFGLGHLMRSIALAEEADACGWRVRIVGDLSLQAVASIAAHTSRLTHEIIAADSIRAGLREEVARWEPDVLHLDTYWLGAEDVAASGLLTSTMQDGVHGYRPANIAIDATLGAECGSWDQVHADHALLGITALPLRRQVLEQRRRETPPPVPPRVLVVLGGTDPSGLTPRVVRALSTLPVTTAITVVTPENIREAVEVAAATLRHPVTVRGFTTDLPALAAQHSLVISAAGTTTWDLAAMGVPAALLAVAENQLTGYSRAIEAGAGLPLGVPFHADLEARVAELGPVLADPTRLSALSQRGRELVDGLGAWRVVASWEQLLDVGPLPVPTCELSARDATITDAPRLLSWRNDDLTRHASRSANEVSEETHLSWLRGVLLDVDRRLLIIEGSAGPVGTVRWDRLTGVDWEVSITISPDRRGQRLALPAILAGEAALAGSTPRDRTPQRVVAYIHNTNVASRRLFASAGYLPHQPADDAGFAGFAKWLRPGPR